MTFVNKQKDEKIIAKCKNAEPDFSRMYQPSVVPCVGFYFTQGVKIYLNLIRIVCIIAHSNTNKNQLHKPKMLNEYI